MLGATLFCRTRYSWRSRVSRGCSTGLELSASTDQGCLITDGFQRAAKAHLFQLSFQWLTAFADFQCDLHSADCNFVQCPCNFLWRVTEIFTFVVVVVVVVVVVDVAGTQSLYKTSRNMKTMAIQFPPTLTLSTLSRGTSHQHRHWPSSAGTWRRISSGAAFRDVIPLLSCLRSDIDISDTLIVLFTYLLTCTEVSGVENIGQCGRLSQFRWLLGAL